MGDVDGLTLVFAILATVLAAAAVRQQRKSEALRRALAEGDYAPLVRDYRNLLKRDLPPTFEQRVRMVLSWLLSHMEDYEESLYELDQVAVDKLSVPEVAAWLNNRAYVLVMLGRPADAIDHLSEAEELLAGEAQSGQNLSLQACITGTRGIALYREGKLEEAEAALQHALRLANQNRRNHLGDDPAGEHALTAERWWWLAEIARARGDEREAGLRLRKAAAFAETPFGIRARRTLAALPEAA